MIPTYELGGRAVPAMFYGTAWKEERTAQLTRMALDAGFVAIDTANQRKHYHEAGVGEALVGRARERLFLQTKFTYERGQDHRLPYDPAAPLAEQVAQSLRSSCEHLGVEHIDSLVLHGPELARGISAGDLEVWRAMERAVHDGSVSLLGASNISCSQLEALLDACEIAPAIVQNRCFARAGWDREVRALCAERGMRYQGFSLLTANTRELADERVLAMARRHGASVAQLVFRFALRLGMIVLTGTTDPQHMLEDLDCVRFDLDEDEVALLESIATR
ncbi:MAG: aldo/keto reductase [Myxococcales bacterium]|nr:aldo/keto reductase [Myxococcales bacterium]